MTEGAAGKKSAKLPAERDMLRNQDQSPARFVTIS